MAEFKIWCPDLGETEDDAETVRSAFGFEDAAEEGARRIYAECDGSSWANSGMTLHVSHGGAVHEVRVSVDFDPTFYASDKGAIATLGGQDGE